MLNICFFPAGVVVWRSRCKSNPLPDDDGEISFPLKEIPIPPGCN